MLSVSLNGLLENLCKTEVQAVTFILNHYIEKLFKIIVLPQLLSENFICNLVVNNEVVFDL